MPLTGSGVNIASIQFLLRLYPERVQRLDNTILASVHISCLLNDWCDNIQNLVGNQTMNVAVRIVEPVANLRCFPRPFIGVAPIPGVSVGQTVHHLPRDGNQRTIARLVMIEADDAKLNLRTVLQHNIAVISELQEISRIFSKPFQRTPGHIIQTVWHFTDLQSKNVAGSVGFEPTDGLSPSTVFKTAAISHSANSP